MLRTESEITHSYLWKFPACNGVLSFKIVTSDIFCLWNYCPGWGQIPGASYSDIFPDHSFNFHKNFQGFYCFYEGTSFWRILLSFSGSISNFSIIFSSLLFIYSIASFYFL
jgi:hypothetical protein